MLGLRIACGPRGLSFRWSYARWPAATPDSRLRARQVPGVRTRQDHPRRLTGVYKYMPRGIIALVIRYKFTPMEAGVHGDQLLRHQCGRFMLVNEYHAPSAPATSEWTYGQ